MSLSELLASYGLPSSAIPSDTTMIVAGERSTTRKRRHNGNPTHSLTETMPSRGGGNGVPNKVNFQITGGAIEVIILSL